MERDNRTPVKDMKAKFLVISERFDSYMGKRGKIDQRILALLDLEPEHALVNTIDYVLNNDEEVPKYSGKCQGKRVELAILDLTILFGRVRARGRILGIN